MQEMNRNPAPTKGQVERVLKRSIPESVWSYANRHNFVSEAMEHSDAVAWLAPHIEELLALAGKAPAVKYQPKRKQRRLTRLPLRRLAAAAVIAAHADQRPDVIGFRQKYLRSGLLRFEQVGPWIRALASEATPVIAVIATLPPGAKLRFGARGTIEFAPEDWHKLKFVGIPDKDCLAFGEPGSSFWETISVGREGPLRELYNLASYLSRFYNWQAGQATHFVLTGNAPAYAAARITYPNANIGQVGDTGLTAMKSMARIGLNIDPLLTPQEVAAIYAEVRAEVIPGKFQQMSERQLYLAEFCAGRPISKELMKEWNNRYQQWVYRRFALFGRDARTSQERVLLLSAIKTGGLLTDDPAGPQPRRLPRPAPAIDRAKGRAGRQS